MKFWLGAGPFTPDMWLEYAKAHIQTGCAQEAQSDGLRMMKSRDLHRVRISRASRAYLTRLPQFLAARKRT